MEVSMPLQTVEPIEIQDGKFEGCRLVELPLDDVRELARVGRGRVKYQAIRLVIARQRRTTLEERNEAA